MSIKCFFGFHKPGPWQPVFGPGELVKAIEASFNACFKYRFCERCGKRQSKNNMLWLRY